MFSREKRSALLAISVIIALAATGCSAASPGEGDDPPAKQSTLEKIKERGTLTVGMSATYEPWEYFEGTKIVGFDPDLIADVASDLGVKPEMMDTDWTGVIPSFYANQFDVIISAMTVSEDRAKRVLFTQPYETHLGYFVTKDPEIKSNKDMGNKVLAAVATDADSDILDYWASLGHTFKDILFLSTQQEAFLAVKAGRADVAVGAYPAIRRFTSEYPEYKYLPGWGPTKYTAIAVRQGDETLCHALDKTITKLKDSGKLAKRYEKWFGFPPAPDPDEPLSYKVC